MRRPIARASRPRLAADRVPARPYHAGLTGEERSRNQELFLRDEVRVICATIAFGMGINKPNVRFVLHYDLPKNASSLILNCSRWSIILKPLRAAAANSLATLANNSNRRIVAPATIASRPVPLTTEPWLRRSFFRVFTGYESKAALTSA